MSEKEDLLTELEKLMLQKAEQKKNIEKRSEWYFTIFFGYVRIDPLQIGS